MCDRASNMEGLDTEELSLEIAASQLMSRFHLVGKVLSDKVLKKARIIRIAQTSSEKKARNLRSATITEIDFSKWSIWVQIHNLPPIPK